MTSPYYILDDRGRPKPVDLDTFGAWCVGQNLHIAETMTTSCVLIETYYSGRDLYQHDPPQLWETMITGGERDRERFSWASLAEAQAGHQRVVAGVCAEYG
jgi:hypothetical protein